MALPSPRPSDHDLLRAYATHHAQDAFAHLVTRHVDMVYAAARRQLAADADLAQDVTQAVFLLLARRAGRLGPHVCIPGWLYTATRYAAANARRAAAARRHHERQAAKLMPRQSPPAAAYHDATADWDHLAPHLDAALARLPATDRNAVLLRFIENKSHADVGASLGLSEEAARKRITRALNRLRTLLLRRNVALPAMTTFATLLTANATEAAPAALVTAITSSPACVVAPPAAALALAKSTHATLTWIKLKFAAAACLAVSVAIAAAAPPALLMVRPPGPVLAASADPAIAPPSAPIHLAADAPPAPAPAARAIEGTVVTPAGDPIADAEVILGTPEKSVNAYGPNPNRPRLLTEPDGKFSFPRPTGEWQIVIRTDAGYAQVTADDLAKSPHVTLQPWGRLEGTLYAGVGGKPMPRHPVSIDPGYTGTDMRPYAVKRSRKATTDDAGHFVFDHVAPGDLLVCQSGLDCKWEWAVVEPGKTASVKLGLAGPPVTGQLVPPPDGQEQTPFAAAPRSLWRIEIRPDRTKPLWTPPDGWDTWPEQRKWEFERQQRWDQTPEGRDFRRSMYGEACTPGHDGRFRIDALRPGNYRLTAYCFARDPRTKRERVINAGTTKFTVPDSAPSDKPIEIPPVPTKSVPKDDGL